MGYYATVTGKLGVRGGAVMGGRGAPAVALAPRELNMNSCTV